jgi:molybdopterin molybdotransferase
MKTKRPSLDEALALILGAVAPGGSEDVPVTAALGRVLAADLCVPRDFPDLPRSAVDGFALVAAAGREHEIVGEIQAGRLPDLELTAGQAAAVMTGAVVPAGADTVVMIEHCRIEGDRVIVPAELRRGDLVNPVGDEAKAGEPLAAAGTVVTPGVQAALLCAGLGAAAVRVRPRVGLLISGDEVLDAGDGFRPGMVFDTNRHVLAAICDGLGVAIAATAKVPDEPTATRTALDDLCRRCDFVVTSGGVSRGRYDHVGEILRAAPYEPLLTGTAIKPGKPLHVVRSPQGALVVGMPGYPASFLTNAFLYLVPALKKASGRADHRTTWLRATTETPLRYRPGRQDLNRVELRHEDGRWLARDPGSQMSSHFLNFARVGGIVRMPTQAPAGHDGGAVELPAGSEVAVLHLGLELA